MSEERPEDDTAARLRRLEALRALMGTTSAGDESHALGRTPAPQPAQPQPRMEALSSAEAHRSMAGARRWRAVALIGVAALVIVATVGVAMLRGGGANAPGSTSAPALSVRAFSLANSGGVYCSSEPAWSPDGKHLAVFGQTNTPTNECIPYDDQTALIVAGVTDILSTNHADSYALAILDSANGHVIQRITLPTLGQSALCQGVALCSIQSATLRSLAWSPDGRSVGVFFTYERLGGATVSKGPQSIQLCGGLLLAQVGASTTPRLLLAAAAPQTLNADPRSGLPRFTWNLATGAATTAAIPGALTGSAPPFTPSYLWAPNGQFIQTTGDTAPFAPVYQWTPDGQLVAASSSASQFSSARGAVISWSSGVIGQRRSASDPALYRASLWAWSPDGQYVTPNLAVSAYLKIPNTQQPSAAAGSYMPALISPPYAAMSAAITKALASEPGVELALRPDGKLLADFACTGDGIGHLTIRSAKSDTELARMSYTYPSSVYSLGCFGDIGALVWSPDGSRIAITDEQDSQIILWQIHLAP